MSETMLGPTCVSALPQGEHIGSPLQEITYDFTTFILGIAQERCHAGGT